MTIEWMRNPKQKVHPRGATAQVGNERLRAKAASRMKKPVRALAVVCGGCSSLLVLL